VTIQPGEAAEALKAADAASGRSVAAAGYARVSPHLFVWGAIWIVMNLLGVAKASHGGLIWITLSSVGVAATVAISLRTAGGRRGRERLLRALLITLAVALFSFALPVILPEAPFSFIQVESLICLAIGAAYLVMGTFIGLRLSAVGVLVMLGTMAVNLWAGEQFFAWMALIGGGGLILGGLWLRRA
jgi:hypothetical protein